MPTTRAELGYPGVHDPQVAQAAGRGAGADHQQAGALRRPAAGRDRLGRYFRWIIGGDTLPQQKPDPAALLFVMRLAGVEAQQALFVGDSRNDVLAARAASVPCVALSYGYNHGRPIAEDPGADAGAR